MRVCGSLLAGIGIVWLMLGAQGSAVSSSTIPVVETVRPGLGPTSEMSHTLYLPLVIRDYGPRSSRLGFCALSSGVDRYVDVRGLSAGWYLQFMTNASPPRPMGMDYVQVVRVHQLTTCWPLRTRNRSVCPYVTPHQYVIYLPSNGMDGVIATAQANPGMLWLIGNEMDRRDWEGGGQDEMLPELYATAYHELYHAIKGADPTAKVAIGGVVQPTPLRLEYLTKVWDTYYSRYGANMPVDVWNVHNFIFKERSYDYGADVPPGYPGTGGVDYADTDHNSMVIFDRQIRDFRQWMKERGQQQKPLIVSEYGIVYRHAGMNNFTLVRNFMLNTFNYFMDTKDCSLGYHEDECRLVQRWAWYSLDDNNPDFNDYAYLINPNTGRLTSLGEVFANYARAHLDVW